MKTFTFQAVRIRWEAWRQPRETAMPIITVRANTPSKAWNLALTKMNRLFQRQHAKLRLHQVTTRCARRGRL
jgi:hypothetical protein